MLNFEELRVKNFLSFGEEEQVVRFDNLSGVRWIYGENLDEGTSSVSEQYEEEEAKAGNGAGKSSFPIAIGWILFGEVLKRKNIKLNRIANRKSGKHVLGHLTFVANNVRYRIERYRQYKSLGNGLFLFKQISKGTEDGLEPEEWEDMSRDETNETQDLINNIILINHQTFMKSILFARDDMTDFLEMNQTDRGKIFENIIQLSKFQGLWNNNYNKLLAIKKLLTGLSEEITSLEKTKEKTKIFFDKEIITLKQKKKENAESIAEQESILKKFGNIDTAVISTDLKLYADLKQDVANGEADIRVFSEKVKDMKNRIVERTNKIAKNEKRIKDLQEENANLKPETCENCGHIQHQNEWNKKKKQFAIDIEDWQSETEEHKKELIKDEEYLIEIELKLGELSSNYQVKYQQFKKIALDESLRKKLDKSKTDEAMKNIIDEIVGASDKINSLKAFKIDATNLHMYREEIRKDSKELAELYKDRSAKTKRKEIMEILHAILDVKEEHSIKNHLVSQIVPVFNTILQKNMSTMYEGKVDLSFDSNMKETLTVNDYAMFPEEFSTGERNKLNFVINLSIFDLTRINLNGSNIIFFDEIFTSLDKPTIKKMIALILAKFGTDTLIHIVSHDDYVKSNVKPVQTLKIVKKDDESRIIIES